MGRSSSACTTITQLDGRHHERMHMFVAATLSHEKGSYPVHIRNMSINGALLEGSDLPAVGSAMLRRGRLQSPCRIVWQAGRRAGIAFEQMVHCPDWMSRNIAAHQARVDATVREIRRGASIRITTPTGQLEQAVDLSFEAELHSLKAELSELGDKLMNDVIVVATHPDIQLIDVALQRVERMLNRISSVG